MLVIRAQDHIVDSLAFSPDGRTIASCASSSTCLHDSATGELVRQWDGLVPSSALRFLPDGSGLVIRGYDSLRLQPIAADGPTWVLPGWFSPPALSPDGRTVAAYHTTDPQQFHIKGNNGDLSLRRLRTASGAGLAGGWGGSLASSDGERGPLGAPEYSPDGRMLATCFKVRVEEDRYRIHILFWDAESGEPQGDMLAAVTHGVDQIAFSPDGAVLAAINGPRLLVWDVRTLTPEATRKTGLQHFKAMAFTPDGRHLITVNNDRAARLWDTATWAEVRAYEWKINKLRSVAVSPDGLRFAAGSINGKIVVWDNDD